MSRFENILIIGAGSWGTALACQVAKSHKKVTLFSRTKKIVDEILNNRTNSKYLNDIKLPCNIFPTCELNLSNIQLIIIAVPSNAFDELLSTLDKSNLNESTVLLIATKGLSSNPTQLLSKKVKTIFKNEIAFISGPNFAKEVALDLLTYGTIAAENIDLAKDLAASLTTKNFIINPINDIVTIQVAGAIKNVIAIKSGIYEALGYKENAKAGLISEGLREISTLSKVLGGTMDTLIEPAVVGDLALTCYSQTSRNTKFGYSLALNLNNKDFLKNYPFLVEGIHSTKLIIDLIREYKLDLPIVSSVAKDLGIEI